jgi:ElaB/YqjD/DUF883 family membrane-anchored ribosome-binding protein
MTDNMDFSKIRPLVHKDQFENVEKIHSLQKVSEEIQQTIDVVDSYKRQLESLQPPVVNGEPWYKFSFGKASVTEVNKVMKSFSDFVQKTFKLVALVQNFQNENDINICRLVGLLAIVEANSYEKLQDLASEMKDLSTEDEESARQLKELEKSFLQSLDDSAIDSTKKEEQMSRLIDYVTLFAQSKTKKIRSISLSLSEIKKKLDEYCSTQDQWIENANKKINLWEEEANNNFAESQEKFISQSKEQTSQALDALAKKRDDDIMAIQNELRAFLNKTEELVNENLAKTEEKTNALTKSQEEFISQSKEQTSSALSEFQKEAKHKTTEIQEQTDGFIEKQNALFAKMKKQQRIYKVVSISALAVSLASLLYAILI